MSDDYTKINKANHRLVELSKKATDQNIVRIADLQSQLTASEKRVKELEKHYNLVVEGNRIFSFENTNLRAELDKLKGNR